MKKLLTVLAVAGLILLGSSPAGAAPGVVMWGVGNPAGTVSGQSPVIFKFDSSLGDLPTVTFGFDALNWMSIKGLADSGKYLYASQNTYDNPSEFRIAKIDRSTGAALTSTSIFGWLGQTNSQVIALKIKDGKLYGVENAMSSGSTLRGYAIEIHLNASGDVIGATPGAYIGPSPDGALTFYDGLWYATSHGLQPNGVDGGSVIFTSPNIMTTAFTQVGSGNSAVVGIISICGWEFDNAGSLLAVESNNATQVFTIDLPTRQATQRFNLSLLPNVTSLDALSDYYPDTTPPVVTVPGDMTVISASPIKVTYSASALDDVDGPLTPSCSPASGKIFQLGSTTVTCTATDSSGNTGTSSFVVIVGVPAAPTGVWAKAGDASATVNFSPPWNNGGAPIASYTVTSAPGGVTASGPGSPIIVTGLDNDTPYTFTVRAINSAGRTSPESSPSNSVTPMASVPAAPSGVWATPGDSNATITFIEPWNKDSVPAITGYVFTIYPGGGTQTRPGSSTAPFIWTGLTNGTAYTFTVRATNSRGTGPESSPSNSMTPVPATPNMPAGIWAKEGDESATVHFSTPWTPVGTTLTHYTITVTPGGEARQFTPSGLSVEQYLWTGLTNGTAYTFTATATNSLNRTSAVTPSSNSVTPTALAPVVPAGIWAEAGDAKATVHFSRPWTPAGTTLTNYTITITPGPGGGPVTILPSGAATEQYVWTGLTNDTTYTFTVHATNSVGRLSPESPSSNSVTPKAAVPAAPAHVWATAGNGSVTISFIPPWNADIVPAITSYEFICYPSGDTYMRYDPSTGPYTWMGLTNGVTYTFAVRAYNNRGRGPWTLPSNSATPAVPTLIPAAPAGVEAQAGDTTATVTFGTPWTPEGTTITGYTVTSSPGGITASGTASPIIVTGLTNGIAYTFKVRATNSAGQASPDSQPSSSVTPQVILPGAPVGIWAQAGDESATVHFTKPWTPVGVTITSYEVTVSPGGTMRTFTPSGFATEQFLWTGLTNGTAYTFTANATNSLGRKSPDCAPSLSVTPLPLAPATPVKPWVEAGDASATVHFRKPWTPEGTTITGYTLMIILPGGSTSTVSISPSGSADATEQYVWTGLTNGAPYTFKVMATNSAGRSSAYSLPSDTVRPIE